MAREIILDVETTGLSPLTGHRVIELACIELEDFTPTGRSFHKLVHPDRDIDPEAERVHGISLASLHGKPRFHEQEVAHAFLEFVGEDVLIAHNAPFDRGFINAELARCNLDALHESRWIDTLTMAQAKFPGMYNSLDALCKRFKVSLAEREKHGALIDCKLLAQVYLELRGGRERGLEFTAPVSAAQALEDAKASLASYGQRPRPLAPRSTPAEREIHAAFVAMALKDKAVWLKTGL